MPITRSESKKNPEINDIAPGQNGGLGSQVNQYSVQSSVDHTSHTTIGLLTRSATTSAQIGKQTHSQQEISSQLAKNMSKITDPKTKTPVKPGPKQQKGNPGDKPGDKEEWSLDSLAKLIKDSNMALKRQITGINTNVKEMKTDLSTLTTWQAATDLRLDELELAKTQHDQDKIEINRKTTKIDLAYTTTENELATLRQRVDRAEKQLIATQAVLKKVYTQENLTSRNMRSFNLRIGNLGEPVTPNPTGATGRFKPREDTRQLVAEFIVEYGLFPDTLDPEEILPMIDVAYRTGKPNLQKPRNIFVKFCSFRDRNTVMRTGKITEREKKL